MENAIAHLGLLEEEAIALDIAALELAALDHPEVVLAPYLDLLDEMTEHLARSAGFAENVAARAAALGDVTRFFGFAGDRERYDDPANADLIRVIDRRRGLPVSLAILHVALARRLGWQADALNTPGHVLVRVGTEIDFVLVGAFDDSTVVSPAGLDALLRRALGTAARPTADHLAPMSNRSVLTRLLVNQASRAEAAGDVARALTLYRRIATLAPENAHAWWACARLEMARGRVDAARASLSSMLEVTRDQSLREHIFAALDAI